MKIDKKTKLIMFALFCFFAGLTNASGQDEFNPRALEYYKLCLEYMVIGDYDNAIYYCNVVLRYNPESADTYVIRARAYFEKGDMANAISDATRAISHDRNNVSARIIRGNAYAINGDFTRAISDWQAVLRLEPENTDAQANIELARERQRN